MRPIYMPGGDPQMIHAGCKAVRSVIERVQLTVDPHGHIHESRGIKKIGRTTCFNPGSEYTIGLIKRFLLNVSRDRLESFKFLSA
jgi:Icc-related predicted phosphoesterase